MDTFHLANQSLQLEFSRITGALLGMTATQTGWKLLDRPDLGLSFQLLVQLSEELRNNPIYGEKQALSMLEFAPDERSAVFTWTGSRIAAWRPIGDQPDPKGEAGGAPGSLQHGD